jgi:hypothetical protein
MVGGKIKDFFYRSGKDNNYIVKFLVVENKDTCTVQAEVPKSAIDFGLIKIGLPIWWHNPSVLIKIEETRDVPFKKIGNSGGDEKSYYEEKKNQLTH